jgi:hypothetical protein
MGLAPAKDEDDDIMEFLRASINRDLGKKM